MKLNGEDFKQLFLDVPVSLFPDSWNTTPIGVHSMRDVLQDIRVGKYKGRIEILRKLIAEGKRDEYLKKKEALRSFTMSAHLTTRAAEVPLSQKLVAHSNLLQVDIDKRENLEEYRARINTDPHTAFSFLSPSGEGLKVGVRIDGSRHEASFCAVERYFLEKYGVPIDPKVKEIPRLCYISYDPDLFINDEAEIFPVGPADQPITERDESHTGNLDYREDRSERERKYGEHALDTARKMIEGSVDGQKLNELLKAAELLGGYVQGGLLTLSAARETLRATIKAKPSVQSLKAAYKAIEDGLNHGRTSPIEFEALEKQRKIYLESIHSKTGVPGVPGVQPNTGADLDGNTEKNPDPSSSGPAFLSDPVQFEEFCTPPIPASLLPAWAGEFAGAVAEAIQVPDELAVCDVIGAISTAVSRKFVIEVKPGYQEPLNVYELCALESGERKSATLAACDKPVRDWETNAASGLSDEIKRAKSEVKTLEKIIDRKRNQAAKIRISPDERQEIIKQIQELEETMPKIPIAPRLIADDITPERTAGLLDENDERIAILSAEGGIFDILAGRYSNGVPNLDLFLKGHSGDPYMYDRKTGVPINLHAPAITMCLSPQPEVIRGLASKPGFRGRGLLGRFLYYMPQSRIGYRSTETAPVSQIISENYQRNIHALINYPWLIDGEKVPYILVLSAETLNQWKEFAGLVELELRDGGQFETMTDWAGKLPGQAARLAGIFHLIKHAGTRSIPLTVEVNEMNFALQVATLLSLHAKAAFGLMGTDPEIEAAKHILAWIKRDRPDTFTGRDCHRAVRGRYPKMAQVSPGLKILEERGFIYPAPGEQTGPGRPRGPFYTVNPKVLEEDRS